MEKQGSSFDEVYSWTELHSASRVFSSVSAAVMICHHQTPKTFRMTPTHKIMWYPSREAISVRDVLHDTTVVNDLIISSGFGSMCYEM